MRKSLLAGLVIALASAVAVWLGDFFGLELDSIALLGVALGAVVALVPAGSPGLRLVGFLGGIVVTWIGYVIRAALLPDTASGRAVAAFIIVALCTVVVAASLGKISFWSTLLGAGALVGAYESVYAAAPPEVASTSVSTVTTLLLTVGIGYLAASFFAPANWSSSEADPYRVRGRHGYDSDRLDAMEHAK